MQYCILMVQVEKFQAWVRGFFFFFLNGKRLGNMIAIK